MGYFTDALQKSYKYLIIISLCISKTAQRGKLTKEASDPTMINMIFFFFFNSTGCNLEYITVRQALDAAPETFKTLKEDIEICNYADTGSQI